MGSGSSVSDFGLRGLGFRVSTWEAPFRVPLGAPLRGPLGIYGLGLKCCSVYSPN